MFDMLNELTATHSDRSIWPMTNVTAHLDNISQHKDNEKRSIHKIHTQRSFSGWTLHINTNSGGHGPEDSRPPKQLHLARTWADSEEGKG